MLDDCRLVELALCGDAEAFAQLVRKYQGPLITSAYHLVGNTEDAQDIAQETFIDAYKQLPSLQDSTKLKGWLFAILRNKSNRLLQRRRADEVSLELCDDEPATPSLVDDRDLLELIGRLPLADREVLTARYLQELSFDEIAELLGASVMAVQMRCSRARQRLRQLVLQVEEEETRVMLRRTMGVIMVGGISETFVHRVLTEVKPMLHAPTLAGHAPAPHPLAPLAAPLHMVSHLAGWHVAAGVTALLMVAGAGMLITQRAHHATPTHSTPPAHAVAVAAPSLTTPPTPQPAAIVPPNTTQPAMHKSKTTPAAKAPAKIAEVVPTIPVIPGQMRFRYKIHYLGIPYPKEYIEKRIAQLQQEKPVHWQEEINYLNLKRTEASRDEEIDYWIESPNKFRWDEDRGAVYASDGRKLTMMEQIEPRMTPVGSMQISPVDVPGKAFTFGVCVENLPYLGYQQPGKIYRTAQHDTITKTKDGFTEYCQVPHQYSTVGEGKPEMVDITLNFDRQGRLTGLEHKRANETYEFRDFVQLGPKAYYPRVVVRKQWTDESPGNPPRQAFNVITYTVEKADAGAPISAEDFSFNYPPKTIQVQDHRYHTPQAPYMMMYTYDGVGTVDEVSKRIYTERLKEVKPVEVAPTIADFNRMHLRYKIHILNKPNPKEYIDQQIMQLQREKPEHWEERIASLNKSRAATSSDGKIDYWIEQPAKFRWDPDGGLLIASDGQKLTTMSQIEPKNLPSKPVGHMLIVPVDAPGKAFFFGVSVENLPYLGYQQPGKIYRTEQHHTITKTKDGFIERCQMPHQYRTVGEGKPMMVDITLNYDRQGRLIRLQREGDDEAYEFRDFVKVGVTSYYPRVAVESRWTEALPGNPPPHIYQVITYTVEQEDNAPLSAEDFSFNYPPKAIDVEDYRYMNPQEPKILTFIYDGVGSIDEASKRIHEERLKGITDSRMMPK